jgi:small subunit ribosomal protein S21
MANNQNQPPRTGKIGITVEKGESIDRAIRRFKKKIDSSKILREYRDRQEYVKPSERRKKEMANAKRREKERRMVADLD